MYKQVPDCTAIYFKGHRKLQPVQECTCTCAQSRLHQGKACTCGCIPLHARGEWDLHGGLFCSLELRPRWMIAVAPRTPSHAARVELSFPTGPSSGLPGVRTQQLCKVRRLDRPEKSDGTSTAQMICGSDIPRKPLQSTPSPFYHHTPTFSPLLLLACTRIPPQDSHITRLHHPQLHPTDGCA